MGRLLSTSALLAIAAAGVYVAFFSEVQFEPKSIKDQRVLVTGASSGIGEQLAYQYAALGAKLVITARRADLLLKVSRACKEMGAPEVHFVAADMASPGDRSEVVEQVRKRLGGLDHLVLNHAILTEGWWNGSAENMAVLEQVLRVNFLSYVDVASKALPMLTASRGRIGVVSSGLGEMGTVFATFYSSAKFALHGFFSSLRQELRHNNHGVSVTLVVLGPVASDAMLENLKSNTFLHEPLPTGFLSSPSTAARAILEGVAQRQYKTYFNGEMKVFRILNAVCPQYLEESFSRVLLGDAGSWMSRWTLLAFDTFY